MNPFSVSYVSEERAAELAADERLIASIAYGPARPRNDADPRRLDVALRRLGDGAPVEIWLGPGPMERGVEPPVAYCRNDTILFGRLAIADGEHSDLEAASEHAYRALFAVARRLGYSYPLRIWNYISRIGAQEAGMERYRSFCVGRHRALADAAVPQHLLPAATGVGTSAGGLQIYFLAARQPGSQVENPRQVSAFRYPPRYSPKSPAFSRAVVKSWGGESHLYVSGTASIVGHESRHEDCAVAQLEETLTNIESLIRCAGDQAPLPLSSVSGLSALKVYMRRERDYEAIARRLRERAGPELPVLYLTGELCREELLLELEGLYTGRRAR